MAKAKKLSKDQKINYKIGRHIALRGEFNKSIEFHYDYHRTRNGKVNAFQMYMKNPKQFTLSKLTEDDAKKSKEYVETNGIYLVSHSSHICNMGQPLDDESYQLKMIADDIKTVERLGGVGTIIHVGKGCGLSEEDCVKNMVNFTKMVIDATPDNKAYFIVETSAGQGSEACVTIEEMAEYHKQIPKKYHSRLRYCIDTCHIFAAGYDISTEKGAIDYINKFDDLIGWNFVELIHFNDSKKECGNRKDRHENIGKGFITKQKAEDYLSEGSGLDTFAIVASETGKALILETPCSGFDAFTELETVNTTITLHKSKKDYEKFKKDNNISDTEYETSSNADYVSDSSDSDSE